MQQPENNKLATNRIVTLFKRFFHYTRPDIYKNIINIFVICSITITGAVMIWMVGQGFDALSQSDFVVVPSYLFGFIALVIFLQVLRYVNYYLMEWMQQRVINSIRRKMYGHIIDLGIPFRDKSEKGDLLTRLGQDIIRVSEFLVLMPAHLFTYSITIILYLGILSYIDSWLTILTILLTPLIVFHQRFFISKTRKSAQSFLSYQGRMGAFEEESLTNMQGIISFSANSQMLKRFDKLFLAFRRAAMRNLLLNNAFMVTFELLIAVTAVLLVTVGVYRIGQGMLTAGGLINFLLYLGYLSVPLRGLANVPIESQIRAVAAERVAEILDEQPNIKDAKNAKGMSEVLGAIRINGVHFSYHENSPVLHDISLEILPGEFIAIMGGSGVGKSTLAKLLLRFYDPDTGSILLDGIDIRDVSVQSLRSRVAVVWQEPFLINDTIFENLRLSKPDATEGEMRRALQDAYADKFIEQLPHGYQTRLGNHGAQLSTGQKQRIAIAQALLKQASVIILDEATSALDSYSESAVQKALRKLQGKSTVIVIAHRLSTVTNSDKIIYINNDGSVSTGTCTELQKKHAQFRNVITHQTAMGVM